MHSEDGFLRRDLTNQGSRKTVQRSAPNRWKERTVKTQAPFGAPFGHPRMNFLPRRA